LGRGTGRKRRLNLLERLREENSELVEELELLRRQDPQAYRKRLRSLDRTVLIGGRGAVPLPHPGRETSPELQVAMVPHPDAELLFHGDTVDAKKKTVPP